MSTPRPLFDAHLHIIDPRFPLAPNQGYLPEEFTAEQYRRRTDGLPVVGGAVVSGSFQGFDQGYLLHALEQLGPGFVGVTQVSNEASDARIAELAEQGVRGVRFNLRRGGSEGLQHLDTLARRVHEVAGMHTELYVDARDLDEIADTVAALPSVSVDHLGLHADGLPALLRLVERGVRVKATGFGRIDLDPVAAMRAVLEADPTALVVGTDLPSTRARRPFDPKDLDLVAEAAGEHLGAVLYHNAAAFYRL
ncbi:amidohydrolase family protein [Nocardiopsis salina]|uniref:amidohydrolase family protein n=1 Tax=Nocardiopsis salina TaxID=245836 RepID=UPI000347BCB3|nr:amidohydrolase family protein [Nocardiopsis salina]